jgi:hypothetical protein
MLSLDFSSKIPSTVQDKDEQGTGFTSVQPNKNGDQYEPSRINLNAKSGTLVLRATKGSNAGKANTLKNTLSVGINANQAFTVSTRLKGPLTNLKTAVQQGGIFLGSSQDNYAKLIVVNDGSGKKDLRIQFFKEENGLGSSVGKIKGLNWAKIKTLDLFLTGDPFTKTVSAAYRVNSNTAAPISLNQEFTPSSSASFFADATQATAGILAFTKNAADVPVTFDSFGIAQNVKINFQLSTANLPAGYIKDSGEAYDATRGYGWVRQDSLRSAEHKPLSIVKYARDRDRSKTNQALDTLQHMQYPDTPAAAWEYAVPNGTYSVSVSVGDQPGSGGVYDSKHTIRVEGVTAINRFQSTSEQEYKLASVKVNVTDGRLTVDAIGGTNTKINYINIVHVPPGKHPSVTDSSIDSDYTGVFRNAAINVDVSLPTVGAGVDPATLNISNVQLYRTKDNARVPGIVGTTGGGDAIVYQPNVRLEANTNYTFRVTSGVRDESGATFIPYTRTFNTGTNLSVLPDPQVKFAKSEVYTGAPISSLVISPDGNKLYAAGLDGKLRRWNINNSSGNLTNLQTFSSSALAGRGIIGIAFDPNNANALWISHNDPLFRVPAKDFTGKISKLTLNGSNFGATKVQDYVVGLPRASKDHLTNSLAFGPDGKLYVSQGSTSAMGAPDPGWYNRPERLLSGTVLQIDPTRTPPKGGFNVQTEKYGNKTGKYNPYATNAPVKIYATGIRNAYDLVWHSNGNLYAPTNGSAAGGNTPDNPATKVKEGLIDVGTQNDYLFKVMQGGYYGHPNPKRNEYIMNGGNPTSIVDPGEVVKQVSDTGKVYTGYSEGIKPDPDYQGFAYDFGRNRSPNGVIEYKSDAFGGALKNKLLVVEYSGGDDILALPPGDNGNIPRGKVTQVISGLTDPLDLIEDTKKNRGNLYVAELIGGGTSGQISLLKVT